MVDDDHPEDKRLNQHFQNNWILLVLFNENHKMKAFRNLTNLMCSLLSFKFIAQPPKFLRVHIQQYVHFKDIQYFQFSKFMFHRYKVAFQTIM